MSSHFKPQQRLNSQYSPHSFTEYVSERTGMRVVIVDQAGPKVQGYFTVATEIHDDSGSPHTLEHLCFMGSKNFPYKGLLDKLATRAYSITNAWTDTDHTAYTLETGGYAAFAQILPVYLEHVLLPTLTDAGCYTEVHHVDGTGHDAGVVYSEMQSVQNQQAELIELQAQRLMYPEGIGFRYETGGMMERLRVLTADRIRKFHRELYQPKNLCVIVIGEINHENLLSVLDTFESDVILPGTQPEPQLKRPWVDSAQAPGLQKSIVETVEFPDEDESIGEVSIRYFGPSCTDTLQTLAMEIVLGYLAGSSASVLENVIVEKEQLASAVYYQQTPRPSNVVEFKLSGVEADRLEAVEARFLELVEQAAESPLDMVFMQDCIAKEERQRMIQAERSESYFTSEIISVFLFSKNRSLDHLTVLAEIERLQKWSERDWQTFIKFWLINNKRVTILGKPSAALAEKLEQEEEDRVQKQIDQLGTKGLQELTDRLAVAQEQNDRPIPDFVMEAFKIPPTDTIHFISTTPGVAGTAATGDVAHSKVQDIIDKDDNRLPLFIHFENIPSNFASVMILVNTGSVPVHLRPLLSVFTEYFFNQPLLRDGKRQDFEETVKDLQKDLIDYGVSSAASLGNAEILNIKVNVKVEQYSKAIVWLKDLLWHGVFEADRIQATIAKILADVPEEKRSGSDMVYAMSDMINDAPESIRRAQSVLVKSVYLKRINTLLKDEPDKVIQQFEELRKALTDLSNMRVFIVTDVSKIQKPVSSWNSFVSGHESSIPLRPLDSRYDRFSDAGMSPGNLCYVTPMSAIDSSYALSTVNGPVESKDARNPALMVAIAYLDAVEGPLWAAVRGTGLAYGTAFHRRVGRLEYSVYSSPDACKAFAVSKSVVEDYVSNASKFSKLALEGAVSSIVLALVNEQPTMETAAVDKFVLEVVKELPRNWNDVLLEQIRSVTVKEIQEAMKDLLLPLFRAETSNFFVTLAPIMKDSMVEGLRALGYRPQVQPLSFFEDGYGLKGDAAGEEEDGEEDDEDGDEIFD